MVKRFKYRPYRTGKGAGRWVRYVLIALATVAALLVVWNRYQHSRMVSSEPEAELVVGLRDISPRTVEIPISSPPAAEPAPEPEPIEIPKPAAPVVQVPPAAPAGDVATNADKTALEAGRLLNQALADKNAGRIIEARDRLNHALDLKLSESIRAEVKNQLTMLSELWLFSRDVLVGDTLSALYEVQPNEKLSIIAKRYKVPYEALMRLNNIKRPELLQAGSKIKVLNGPFLAVIKRSTFTMDLYLQGTFVKSYKVGLGRDKFETPTGTWLVAKDGKLVKPPWTDPDTGRRYIADDPDYPLGSRWIGLAGLEGAAKGRTGFAIHGTKDPETIGTRSSRGCIRLFNGDAIEVYDLMEPGFSEVLVVE